MINQISSIVIGAGIAIGIVTLTYNKVIKNLKKEIRNLSSSLKSAQIKFGQKMEMLAPFTKQFPEDSKKFIFTGQPIDGLIFGDKEITFIEIKCCQSQLSPKQRRIKKQIEEGKVKFLEVQYK